MPIVDPVCALWPVVDKEDVEAVVRFVVVAAKVGMTRLTLRNHIWVAKPGLAHINPHLYTWSVQAIYGGTEQGEASTEPSGKRQEP